MSGIETLTNTAFHTKALQALGPVVVDFYQANCGHYGGVLRITQWRR